MYALCVFLFLLLSFPPSPLFFFLIITCFTVKKKKMVLCDFLLPEPPHADMEGFLRSSFLLRLVSFPLLPFRITGRGKGVVLRANRG